MRGRRHLLHQRGVAIGLVYVAVALVAGLGMALTWGMQRGALRTNDHKAHALAAVLLQQGATLKEGIHGMTARHGITQLLIRLDKTPHRTSVGGNPLTGLYHPVDGATTEQVPPQQAFIDNFDNSNPQAWKYAYAWVSQSTGVRLPGVGTTTGYEALLHLTRLKPEVCRQVNRILTGSTVIPTTSVPVNLSTLTDLTGQAALTDYREICFQDSAGIYQYYLVVAEF